MNYEVKQLNEQKYAGIKTVIQFGDHDEINFGQLHEQVIQAPIQHINNQEAIVAIDSDFTKESFSYTPLIAVDTYEGNESFFHFTRPKGTYYAFKVTVEECGPEWFGRLFEFVRQEGLELEKTGYDLEYYDFTYETRPTDQDVPDSEKWLKILLKKQ